MALPHNPSVTHSPELAENVANLQSEVEIAASDVANLEAVALTSDQNAALDGSLLPPTALNPLVTLEQLHGQKKAISTWATIAVGANADVLPAPPAGFRYVLRMQVFNKSAVVTAGCKVTANAKPLGGTALTTTIAASGNANPLLAVCHPADGIINVENTGLADILVCTTWFLVQTSAFNLIVAPLTSSYVAYPAFTPAAGFALMLPQHSMHGLFVVSGTMNADSASTTPSMRITRGSDSIVLTSAAVAAFTRNIAFAVPPAILPGDVVELKCAVAPAIAGKVVSYFVTRTFALQS